MTFVGDDVTSINAKEATSEAGIATERTGSPRETANSIMIGITIVAVTVLLENIIFNNEIINTITNIITSEGSVPIPESNTKESHFAAPV